jgi:NADH-quinone oxidoreductase subunit I
MSYLKEIVFGGLSLVEGMVVTFRRLFHPLVTVQYPRKTNKLSDAYRGHIELKRSEEPEGHLCIACGTCERMCPSGVIRVQGLKDNAKSPKVGTHFIIDFSKCSLCGLCVESCPTGAIQYSKEYSLVGVSHWDCVFDLMERLRKCEPIKQEAAKSEDKQPSKLAA